MNKEKNYFPMENAKHRKSTQKAYQRKKKRFWEQKKKRQQQKESAVKHQEYLLQGETKKKHGGGHYHPRIRLGKQVEKIMLGVKPAVSETDVTEEQVVLQPEVSKELILKKSVQPPKKSENSVQESKVEMSLTEKPLNEQKKTQKKKAKLLKKKAQKQCEVPMKTEKIVPSKVEEPLKKEAEPLKKKTPKKETKLSKRKAQKKAKKAKKKNLMLPEEPLATQVEKSQVQWTEVALQPISAESVEDPIPVSKETLVPETLPMSKQRNVLSCQFQINTSVYKQCCWDNPEKFEYLWEEDGHYFHLVKEQGRHQLSEFVTKELYYASLRDAERVELNTKIKVYADHCFLLDGSRYAKKMKAKFQKFAELPKPEGELYCIDICVNRVLRLVCYSPEGKIDQLSYLWHENQHFYEAGYCEGKFFFEEKDYDEYQAVLQNYASMALTLGTDKQNLFVSLKSIPFKQKFNVSVENFMVSLTSPYLP